VSALLTALVGLGAALSAKCSPSFDVPCPYDRTSDSEFSLAYAVDLALCSNAEIQIASASVRIRAAELGESRAAYWPSVNATVSEVREITSYPGDRAPNTTETATTIYGALTWRLFDFGVRSGDVRAASQFLEAALGTRDATIQKVLGSVIESYFDAVTAKALMNAKVEDESLARKTLGSAVRRLDRGDGAQTDSLQARTALARDALELNRARSAYEKALALLAYTVGLPPGTHFNVPDEPEESGPTNEKSLAAWLDDARRQHPAIVSAHADVEAAEAQVQSARSSNKPTLDLQVNYYANGFPQQGLATNRQRSTTIGLVITVPVFDGFLHRYKVHAAEATLQVKEAMLVDTERVTLTEIVKAYSDATAAAADLLESQELLDSARSSQDSSRRRYDSGATDIQELLNTQAALADARQERVRSVADWRSARLRLLATSGILANSTIDQ
jgi:outer membrane protein